MSRRVIYQRGFPYGAPWVCLRGGALRDPAVKDFVRASGFQWEMSGRNSHGYETYLDRSQLGPILKTLRDDFNCEVLPKEGMDAGYLLNLDDPKFGRPE